MIGHQRRGTREPKIRHGRENTPLIRNGRRQDDVKGRETIGGHNEEVCLIHCINIADLALEEALNARQIRGEYCAHSNLSA